MELPSTRAHSSAAEEGGVSLSGGVVEGVAMPRRFPGSVRGGEW